MHHRIAHTHVHAHGVNTGRKLKAKFHYASWFGAGSELVRSWFDTDSVMEFGFNETKRRNLAMCIQRRTRTTIYYETSSTLCARPFQPMMCLVSITTATTTAAITARPQLLPLPPLPRLRHDSGLLFGVNQPNLR